jgi:hypothetical protein
MEQLTIELVPMRRAVRSETMTAKTITTPHESPKDKDHEHEKQESLAETEKKDLDRELDRELADSFPASDPPSVTQPAPKWGSERKHSRRR